MKKVRAKRVQLARHVVLPVELNVGEHPQEDILGEDVLQQHLPHVRVGHVGTHRAPTQFKKAARSRAVIGVAGLRLGHRGAQIVQNRRKVRFELLPRLPELLDLRACLRSFQD